jgi:ankyrin repeat protein
LFLNERKLFECETRDKKRPIDTAAEYGNLDIIKHLFEIEQFRMINGKDEKKGITVLINAAVCHRESEVLSFLKRQHEHLLHRRLNTLHFACRQLHGHKMVSHLINKGSIMYQDKQTGCSPLMVAIQHHQIECVKELLSHKDCTQEAIDLVSSVNLRTVFHICAEVNEKGITKVLCQSRYMTNLMVLGADISGDTPLHICAKVGNVYMTKILIHYIKNISTLKEIISPTPTSRNMKNLDANSQVTSKLSSDKKTTTNKQIFASGHVYAMLNKRNKNNHTPLHVAIYNGNLNVIKEILNHSHPSVVNACDDQKRTSLHMAAEKGEKVINYNSNASITVKILSTFNKFNKLVLSL